MIDLAQHTKIAMIVIRSVPCIPLKLPRRVLVRVLSFTRRMNQSTLSKKSKKKCFPVARTILRLCSLRLIVLWWNLLHLIFQCIICIAPSWESKYQTKTYFFVKWRSYKPLNYTLKDTVIHIYQIFPPEMTVQVTLRPLHFSYTFQKNSHILLNSSDFFQDNEQIEYHDRTYQSFFTICYKSYIHKLAFEVPNIKARFVFSNNHKWINMYL